MLSSIASKPRPTIRETHLAEKALQMRLPISARCRNQLIKRILHPMYDNSTHPDEMPRRPIHPNRRPPTTPVTHLAKKPLKMRHKISTNHRNQLNNSNLHPYG